MNLTLPGKVQGSLMGAQLGDALGMPVETMTHEEIMALNGGAGVTGFMDPVQRKITQMASLKAGDTTDDWQLTRVIAESLIKKRGFHLSDVAYGHINALNTSTFGWGKTTENAIRDIMHGRRDVHSTAPDLGPNKGCGNGIAMKVAPVSLWFGTKFSKAVFGERAENPLIQSTRELGWLTHPDPRAGTAGIAVALTILYAFETRPGEIRPHDLLDYVIHRIDKEEDRIGMFRFNPDSVSNRLRKITGALSSAEAVRTSLGCSFNAVDTAAFTIATFLRHPTDFRAGVLEAVNAGGDTDTHASIVGAMIGAHCGVKAIPEEWISFRESYKEALILGGELHDKAIL